MSNKTRTHQADAANVDQNGVTGGPHSDPVSTDTTSAGKARTDTEEKLWQALCANPNSTAAELSADAGIGRSTAAKILARWANDGTITRSPGIADDGRRAADSWSITNLDAPPASSEEAEDAVDTDENAATPAPYTSTDSHEPTAGGEVTADDGTDSTELTAASSRTPDDGQHKLRLPPGGLRGLVEDWLRDHGGEEFSPSTIGKALGRSSGAVANALDKLVTDGYAVQTQDKPKRFTAKESVERVAQN